jgi:hypothetical protein
VFGPFSRRPPGEVGVAGTLPSRPVDHLAKDIRVSEVMSGLHAHVDKDLVQGHVATFLGPPGHLPFCVDRKLLDRCVAVRCGEPVELQVCSRVSPGAAHMSASGSASSMQRTIPNATEGAGIDGWAAPQED